TPPRSRPAGHTTTTELVAMPAWLQAQPHLLFTARRVVRQFLAFVGALEAESLVKLHGAVVAIQDVQPHAAHAGVTKAVKDRPEQDRGHAVPAEPRGHPQVP